MSRPGKGIWFSALAGLLFLAAAISLAARPTEQGPALNADVSSQVPAAVSTHVVLPTWTRMPPGPTRTSVPLPPPPAASTMQPVAGDPPNIAWGTITDNSLTLWAGRYSDSPSPVLAGARTIAHWALPLDIMSMAASPDGRYLALLTLQRCIPPTPAPTATPRYVNGTPMPVYPRTGEYCMGDWPRPLYIVDLLTNEVRPIPDYSGYALYAEHGPHFSNTKEVMGWFDNDRIALDAGQLLVATKDGSSFEYRNFPNLTGRDNLFKIQLLPDRKTMFVWVNQSYYLRDAHTGDIRKIGNRSASKDRRCTHMRVSPNGRYLSCLGPQSGSNAADNRQVSLSFERFSDNSRHVLIGSGVWDLRPAWSPDNSRIAFARTTAVPTGNATIFDSEKADTDIYIATIADLKVRQLTSFTGVHNRDIQWTPGGNLLLASSYGSRNDAFGIVAVSTTNGAAWRLWTPPPGETLVRPTLFALEPSGMPSAGVDPGQP